MFRPMTREGDVPGERNDDAARARRPDQPAPPARPDHLEPIAAALRRTPGADEFTAMERACERAAIDAGPDIVRRRATGAWVDVTVHRDIGRGRGSALLRLGGEDVAAPEALLAAAVDRAAASVGPAWSLPPPAAPARVVVADPALDHDLEHAADAVFREARAQERAAVRAGRAAGVTATVHRWRIGVERCHTAVRTSPGLASAYDSTLLTIDAVLEVDGQVGRLSGQARRRRDLDIAGLLARGLRRLRDRARAVALAPGRYDLVLAEQALVPALAEPAPGGWPESWPGSDEQGRDLAGLPAAAWLAGPGSAVPHFASIALDHACAGRLGWLGPLAAQAEGRLARLGLTRYQPGQPVCGSRPLTGDPVTLASDGTLPYGLLSRSFAELGAPTRRFVAVKAGTAAGLALDLREAALRGITANGGVRNLVLAPGTTAPAALRAVTDRPVVAIVDLAWLAVDARSGDLVAEIGLGYTDGGTPITGGSVRGNVFDMLAAARLSAKVMHAGWYRGPEAIRFADIAIT